MDDASATETAPAPTAAVAPVPVREIGDALGSIALPDERGALIDASPGAPDGGRFGTKPSSPGTTLPRTVAPDATVGAVAIPATLAPPLAVTAPPGSAVAGTFVPAPTVGPGDDDAPGT
jgi:hypothetical protein